jgi:hypothetical protein
MTHQYQYPKVIALPSAAERLATPEPAPTMAASRPALVGSPPERRPPAGAVPSGRAT